MCKSRGCARGARAIRSASFLSRLRLTGLSIVGVFGLSHGKAMSAAQPDDRLDHVDIDLQQVKVAGYFADLLALARQFLGNVHGHSALGNAAGRSDEHFGAHPFEPRPLRVALELLL